MYVDTWVKNIRNLPDSQNKMHNDDHLQKHMHENRNEIYGNT